MDELTSPEILTLDQRKPSRRRNVPVLQGGGALRSFQGGVYKALTESGIPLDWVAGVSIGAVNAAIIAGNPPERRVRRLREFWETITDHSASRPDLPYEPWRALGRLVGAAEAMIFGQPGFFRPRSFTQWVADRPQLSLYDTSELRATPEHVMASGASPPGLAIVSIDGAHYWDARLVSNTSLQYVLDYEPRDDMRVFQIDLFPARGKLPENLDEVAEREGDIRCSSRTRAGTDRASKDHKLRNDLYLVLNRLSPELREDAAIKHLRESACPETVDIVHLV